MDGIDDAFRQRVDEQCPSPAKQQPVKHVVHVKPKHLMQQSGVCIMHNAIY